VFFAAEETAGALDGFAARNVHAAMCTGNHGFTPERRRGSAALAHDTTEHEVHDGYSDDEKKELAHAAMAARVAAATRRHYTGR